MSTKVAKIAISLPKDLLREVNKMEKEKHTTRSAVFKQALEILLRKRIEERFKEKVRPIYAKLAQEDRALAEEFLPLTQEVWPKD
ncbi:ribbon-helix-helix protein, CopG family [candidate division NPL-UPA2 bacterium]|nr:ribbon-helix-helix protein, CopG family [candidate division NPL-UPA2 bacterium]